MADKQYAERDIMDLDISGNHYSRHISAMTREGLHSKSDIAAELAWRDARIAELENSETQLIQERDNAEAALSDMYQAATGERPEWSNMFGFSDAVADVDERITAASIKWESES